MMYCSDCGAEHSRNAKSCPKCGNPNPAVSNGLSAGLIVGIIFIPVIFTWFTLRDGVSSVARVTSFIWMTIVLILAFADSADDQTAPEVSSSVAQTSSQESVVEPLVVPSISCSNLYEEFSQNEIRALEKFGNKQVKISGRVTDISADFFDNPQIILSSEQDDFGMTSCILSARKSAKYVSQLQKGQIVNLLCKDVGEILGSPTAEKCTMAN